MLIIFKLSLKYLVKKSTNLRKIYGFMQMKVDLF
jgi:hypothetical protein